MNGLGLHFKDFPSRIQESEEDSSENPMNLDTSLSPALKRKTGQENKISNLLKFASENPSGVTILRRVYNRQSGTALFKKYNAIVDSFTNDTVTFKSGTILRLSDIEIKPISNSDPSSLGKKNTSTSKSVGKPQTSRTELKSTKKGQAKQNLTKNQSSAKQSSAKIKSPAEKRRKRTQIGSSSEGNFSLLDEIKTHFPNATDQTKSRTRKPTFSKFLTLGERYLPPQASPSQFDLNIAAEANSGGAIPDPPKLQQCPSQ